MRFIERSLVFAGAILAVAMTALAAPRGAASPEYDPVRRAPVAVAVGPEAARFIVGLRATAANAGVDPVRSRPGRPPVEFRQAHTRTTDAADLAGRVQLALSAVRQLTPSMHLLVLQRRLYGADIDTALKALRADPAVRFAAVDERRYAHAIPDDPLFAPTAGATGQWFMATPDATTPGADAAATDAVSAWDLTTGSTGTVIADVDTGVLFGHPDLGRAGLGGRLLPGYDFVSGDLDPTNGTPLGTFLIANDGDGWDPDPSDPGDWIDASDQSNALFPSKTCAVVDSSWHGTRVMGILGALTNNGLGIAGMTWSPMLLPVRALGKCGGYDSDIISGMQWAVGLPVTGVPNNPFPAQIVNLSLGSTGACPASYQDTIAALGSLGVLVVASAGNEGGAVDAPANCAGVLGVAGLRNIGTKVGYSSFGAQVSIAAPAGNCVNGAGLPCLRPIDTLTSTGLTVPGDDTYTNQANPNLGTSFSAPIVSGIAGLMRAVNANLTPSQLIARIQAAATAFPEPAGTPVCPATDATTGECACPNDGSQCGAGMANAHGAVLEAQRPIAAVALPASSTSGAAVTLDGSGSAAACGRSVAAYAWAATGAVTLASGAGAPQVSVVPAGAGSITLTVTDSLGAVDVAMLAVDAAGVISAGAGTPAAAGNAATACPAALAVVPLAPTVAAAFAPESVGENVVSTLTLTLTNANPFALTDALLTQTLPAGLEIAAPPAAASPSTTCGGAAATVVATTSTVTLSGANIPATGDCVIVIPVASGASGRFTASIAAGALSTGPAGANAVGNQALLTVTAPSHGGGEFDPWDGLLVVGVLLAGRRYGRRVPPVPPRRPPR